MYVLSKISKLLNVVLNITIPPALVVGTTPPAGVTATPYPFKAKTGSRIRVVFAKL